LQNLTLTFMQMLVQLHGMVLMLETQYGSDLVELGTQV